MWHCLREDTSRRLLASDTEPMTDQGMDTAEVHLDEAMSVIDWGSLQYG